MARSVATLCLCLLPGLTPAPELAVPSTASTALAQLQIPRLPLHGGGRMPMAGLGMCCRPTAGGDAARQAVLDYLLMGGRHIDTAQLYQNHFDVGAGVRQAIQLGVPRSEIFLTTKIWPNLYGFESATAWVHDMLEVIGLDYVDLVLLHSPTVDENLPCGTPTVCRQETWLALDRFRDQGKIRYLGVSNFGKRQMSELLALGVSPITTNQFEYHPWVPSVNRETVDWCHQHGIAVTAYGSMGGSKLAEQLMTQDALKSIGAKYGKSVGQVLLRWAVQKNVSVIPGTSNPKHMAENVQIFDFRLAQEEVAILDNVPEHAHLNLYGHTPDKSP